MLYSATFVTRAVAAAQDLFEIIADATTQLEIWEVRLGQYTDFGDAKSEILPVQIIRGFTSGGTGGAAVTPHPLACLGGVSGTGTPRAAVSLVNCNNTGLATGGTPHILIADVMNVMAGWLYQPAIPTYPNSLPNMNERIKVAAGERLVVRLGVPAESLNMMATVIFKELGIVT